MRHILESFPWLSKWGALMTAGVGSALSFVEAAMPYVKFTGAIIAVVSGCLAGFAWWQQININRQILKKRRKDDRESIN